MMHRQCVRYNKYVDDMHTPTQIGLCVICWKHLKDIVFFLYNASIIAAKLILTT